MPTMSFSANFTPTSTRSLSLPKLNPHRPSSSSSYLLPNVPINRIKLPDQRPTQISKSHLTISFSRKRPVLAFSGGDDGGINGGRTGGGGGGGGDGSGGDKNKDESILLLAELGRSLDSLPKDLAAAIESGKIPGSIVERYLELEKSPLMRWLLQFAGFKERLLADDLFLAKVGIECGVGLFTKVLVLPYFSFNCAF